MHGQGRPLVAMTSCRCTFLTTQMKSEGVEDDTHSFGDHPNVGGVGIVVDIR